MATKAQKRAAGEAKAKVLAEESRLSGLKAQQRDHDRRAAKQRELMAKKAADEKKQQEKRHALAVADVARVAGIEQDKTLAEFRSAIDELEVADQIEYGCV